jgi:hypothetical protein
VEAPGVEGRPSERGLGSSRTVSSAAELESPQKSGAALAASEVSCDLAAVRGSNEVREPASLRKTENHERVRMFALEHLLSAAVALLRADEVEQATAPAASLADQLGTNVDISRLLYTFVPWP